MAYSDYGAFVYCNGERRTDKEDAPLFASSQEAFGEDINNIPSGLRIFANIVSMKCSNENPELTEEQKHMMYLRTRIAHGILGDGPVRVRCYKQGLPSIYEFNEDEIKEIKIPYDGDWYEYGTIKFEHDGYEFLFSDDSEDGHYFAEMITPEGEHWTCEYDYEFGAGWEPRS